MMFFLLTSFLEFTVTHQCSKLNFFPGRLLVTHTGKKVARYQILVAKKRFFLIGIHLIMLILGFETFCFQSPCFSNKYGLFLASQGKKLRPSNQKSSLHSIFNTGRFTGEV